MAGGSGSYYNDDTNGYLPSGWYSITGHRNHFDGTINGRVWRLSDKWDSQHCCLRSGLFIRREDTPLNDQGTREEERWDVPSAYLSFGCVKVSYRNIGAVHTRWTDYGGSTAHGSGLPYPLSSKLYAHN